MKTLKVIMVIVIATAIVSGVIVWVLKSYGFRSISFAVLANFLLLDWVAVVSSSLGEKARFYLPEKYYSAKSFEKEGRIYRLIGVRYFKRLVAKGPLAVLASIRFKGKRALLDYLYKETLWGEAMHLSMFLVISVLSLYVLFRRWYEMVVYLMVCNIILNFYPVILQRYNRFRLEKVIQRRNSQKKYL